MAITEDIIVALKVVGINEVTKKLIGLSQTLSVGAVKNQQAMQGLNRQFSAMRKGLEPLKKEVRTAMIEGFVKPSRTAEAAAEGIIGRQKQLVQFSAQMKQKFEAQGRTVTDASKGLVRFRAELLSVLFFGMAVTAMFGALLQPAFQLAGIFEVWSTILQILFLPVALALLDPLLKLLDIFINLSPSAQFLIGVFAIIGFILGKLVFLFGFLGLAMFGIIQALPLFQGAWTAIMGLFSGAFLAIFGIFIVALIGFWLAWKENFGNIRDWVKVIFAGVKNIFTGIKEFITGLIDVFVGFFSGDAKKVKEGFNKMWEGIKKIFVGIIQVLVGVIVTLGLALLRAVLGGAKSLVVLLGEAFGLLWEKLLVPAFNFGKNLIAKIVAGVKAGAAKLGAGIKKILGIGGGGSTSIPGSQIGGLIHRDGPRFLHKGEQVIPAGQNINFNPSIIINVNRGMDEGGIVTRLKQELNEQFAVGLGDLARR